MDATATSGAAISSKSRPHFSGMSHVKLEESKLFYSRVLGGE